MLTTYPMGSPAAVGTRLASRRSAFVGQGPGAPNVSAPELREVREAIDAALRQAGEVAQVTTLSLEAGRAALTIDRLRSGPARFYMTPGQADEAFGFYAAFAEISDGAASGPYSPKSDAALSLLESLVAAVEREIVAAEAPSVPVREPAEARIGMLPVLGLAAAGVGLWLLLSGEV